MQLLRDNLTLWTSDMQVMLYRVLLGSSVSHPIVTKLQFYLFCLLIWFLFLNGFQDEGADEIKEAAAAPKPDEEKQ